MRGLNIICTLLAAALCLLACRAGQPAAYGLVESAFREHRSNVQVAGEGRVDRILRDDSSGLPHQRFIVRLDSGQTILIEHNTSAAPRIDDLRAGDTISFAGEYIWNEQGGLVHWTHNDPAGRHEGGWIEAKGRRYQ